MGAAPAGCVHAGRAAHVESPGAERDALLARVVTLSPLETARRPRIALVGSCYWPVGGGMEVYLRQLALSLAAAGHDVRVITRFAREHPGSTRALHTSTEPERRYDDGPVSVRVVGAAGLRRGLLGPVHRLHYRAPGIAARLLHTSLRPSLRDALVGADVVHYSGAGRELFGFAAASEAARMNVPFVVTPHTHEGLWGDGTIDLGLYRRAARVVALTQDERRRLIDAGLRQDAVAVIGHGVSVRGGGDAARFRSEHGLRDAPMVLFLGRKTADKGFDLLVEAAPAIWDRVPTARIVLAGEGDQHSGTAIPVRDPRIVELGRLTDAQREDAYAACDLFCLPSEAEAFGLVVLEAWSYGKPVVASDIPTLRERLEAGGGVVAARRPAEMADAIVRLLTDDELRGRLALQAAGLAREATWDRAASAMSALYTAAGAGS